MGRPTSLRAAGPLLAFAGLAGLAGFVSLAVPAWAATPDARPAGLDIPLPPDVPAAPAGLPGAPRGRALYYPIAAEQARALGLPPEVADAVMWVESGYDPAVIGGSGERGLMQVMPPTASLLGFSGTLEELAVPETNIRLGVRYLARAWTLAGGDLCRALMKYRAGHGEERMSPKSVWYCGRAKAHLAAYGSPLGQGALPAVDFWPSGRVRTSVEVVGPMAAIAPGAVAPVRLAPRDAAAPASRKVRVGGRLQRVAGVRRPPMRGARFWGAHMARIKAIEARLPWKRGGIMAGG